MDRVTKLLLAVIVLLLGGLLLRLTPSPTFAQTASPPPMVQSQPQLAVSGADVYVLQNGTLYVYEWQDELSRRFSLSTKPAKLSLLLTRPLNERPKQ